MRPLKISTKAGLLAAITSMLLPWAGFAQAPQTQQAPQTPPGTAIASDYSQWETVARYERYGPKDREPAKVDTRVFKHCSRPQDQSAEELMKQEEMMKRLKTQCWVGEKREEAGRTQVKWACRDGMTAEIATRAESKSRIGYMMVFNVPGQGALSIKAESLKIAETCEAGSSAK